MNSRLHKIALFITLLLSIILTTSAFSQNNDDELLLTIPAIIAATNKNQVPGINRIKELQGRWRFTYSFFTDYYRFDKSTAKATPSDPTIFTIQGESSLSSDFSGTWCGGGLISAYSTETNLYLVLCNWGFPDFDIGDLFVFDTINPSFPFQNFTYTPSNGEITSNNPTNGTATQVSTTFNLSLNQTLINPPVKTKTAFITTMKSRRYDSFMNNKTLEKRSLNPRLQSIQTYLKEVLNLKKQSTQ